VVTAVVPRSASGIGAEVLTTRAISSSRPTRLTRTNEPRCVWRSPQPLQSPSSVSEEPTRLHPWRESLYGSIQGRQDSRNQGFNQGYHRGADDFHRNLRCVRLRKLVRTNRTILRLNSVLVLIIFTYSTYHHPTTSSVDSDHRLFQVEPRLPEVQYFIHLPSRALFAWYPQGPLEARHL
jgi:hypothetical protein